MSCLNQGCLTQERWIVPAGAAAGYVALAVAVHLRLLDNLDLAVRRASRPGEVWGPTQIRAARVVNALQPAHLVAPLLVVAALIGVVRRSVRPVVVVAAVGIPAAAVTLASKWIMDHSGLGPWPVGHGSFPSGHTVGVIIATGSVVLLLWPGTRWGWLLPAAVGGVMGAALVLAQVHPATDVLGAGLLAIAALTGAHAASLGEWAR